MGGRTGCLILQEKGDRSSIARVYFTTFTYLIHQCCADAIQWPTSSHVRIAFYLPYLSVLGPRPNQRITRGGILSTYLGVHPYNSFTPDGGRPSVTKYPANTSTTFEMKLTSKRHKSSFYRNIMWLLSQFIMSFHYVISLCLFIITFHDRSGVISQPKLPGSIRYPVWPPIPFKYDGKTSFVTGYW